MARLWTFCRSKAMTAANVDGVRSLGFVVFFHEILASLDLGRLNSCAFFVDCFDDGLLELGAVTGDDKDLFFQFIDLLLEGFVFFVHT